MEEKIKILEKQLNNVENCIFWLDMKDRWEKDDFELNDRLYEERNKIREELEKCKKNN